MDRDDLEHAFLYVQTIKLNRRSMIEQKLSDEPPRDPSGNKLGKIVLAVTGDGDQCWHAVAIFLMTLRSNLHPFWQPVLCLSLTNPPKDTRSERTHEKTLLDLIHDL